MPGILIVEDNEDIREALAEILRSDGYSVATATNGMEALACLRGGEAFSLILLDLMMPVMNGWQFRAEQLKDPELRSVPTVIFTCVADPEDATNSLEADGFLSKTAKYETILETVRSYCC